MNIISCSVVPGYGLVAAKVARKNLKTDKNNLSQQDEERGWVGSLREGLQVLSYMEAMATDALDFELMPHVPIHSFKCLFPPG